MQSCVLLVFIKFLCHGAPIQANDLQNNLFFAVFLVLLTTHYFPGLYILYFQ